MENLLVRINIGTSEEIARLYDVGPRLAQRIIEYREKYGYFEDPDDLAKVLSYQHAYTLAPHISWEVPIEPEKPKERAWRVAIFLTIIILIVGISPLVHFFTELLVDIQIIKIYGSVGWVFVWSDTSILLSVVLTILLLVMEIIASLTTSRSFERKLHKMSLVTRGFVLVTATSIGLSNAIYYQYYAPRGWLELTDRYDQIAIIPVFIFWIFNYLPQLIVLWRPTLGYNAKLARIYDISFILGGPAVAWMTWTNRYNFNLILLILFGIIGFTYSMTGFSTLRSGRSFFVEAIEFLDPDKTTHRKNESSMWLRWINMRLPDPEQQKALKRALNEAYPTSPVRTLGSILVLGAGGWLLVTAISGIVELYVQDWWQQLVCYFLEQRCNT